jgi:hypothetical protein
VGGRVIDRRIYIVRGKKVMLDSDLAELYQVTTGNLNVAVRRNIDRVPSDFMFQLTKHEHAALLLQFARAKTGRGGRQTPPYAFTELGVAMLSSVLNSDRAVQMNILIMRAFVRLREALATNAPVKRGHVQRPARGWRAGRGWCTIGLTLIEGEVILIIGSTPTRNIPCKPLIRPCLFLSGTFRS